MSDANPQVTSQPSSNTDWKVFKAQSKMAWDVTNFYARGIAFFLAINAAVFGYVLKADIDQSIRKVILLFGLVTGILFLLCSIAFVVWAVGVWRTVQSSFLSGDDEAKQKYSVAKNFSRGRVLFGLFAFGNIAVILFVMFAYAFLLFR